MALRSEALGWCRSRCSGWRTGCACRPMRRRATTRSPSPSAADGQRSYLGTQGRLPRAVERQRRHAPRTSCLRLRWRSSRSSTGRHQWPARLNSRQITTRPGEGVGPCCRVVALAPGVGGARGLWAAGMADAACVAAEEEAAVEAALAVGGTGDQYTRRAQLGRVAAASRPSGAE